MEHNTGPPDLLVKNQNAQVLGREDEQRLHRSRKLVLLVNLDQTLVHTTNDIIPSNLKDVHNFELFCDPCQKLWYHARFRPGTQRFLEAVSNLYELHICTFGARAYAHMIARLLDPESRLFASRILSRDECFHPTLKTANLKALFPCGDAMVCIIDDQEDVWRFAPNLVHVRPYRFFDGTADINAPPGLNKSGNESEDAAAFSLPTPGTWFESDRPGKRVVRVIRVPKKKVEAKPVVEGGKMEEGEKVQEPAATKTRKLPVSWSRSKKAADRAAARADRGLSTAEASTDSTSTTAPPSTAAVVSASTAAVSEAAMSETSAGTGSAAVSETAVSEASAGTAAVSQAAVSESTDKLISTEGQTNDTSVANNGMSDCTAKPDSNADTQIDTGNVTDKHTDNGIDKERSKDTEKVTEEDTANETKDKEIGTEIESATDKDTNNVAGRDTNSMIGVGTNSVTDSDTNNVIGGDTKSVTVGDMNEKMKQSVDKGQGGEDKGGMKEGGEEGEWEEIGKDIECATDKVTNNVTGVDTNNVTRGDTNYVNGGYTAEKMEQSIDGGEDKGGMKEGGEEGEWEELIEWEDNDDYLVYLEDILTRIHTAYYSRYDEMIAQTGSTEAESTGLVEKTSSPGASSSRKDASNKTSDTGAGRAQGSTTTGSDKKMDKVSTAGLKSYSDPGTSSQQSKFKSPDLKTIVPYVRRRVLKGVRMMFSGVVPPYEPLETSVAYRAAVAMGASVQTNFIPPTSQTQKKGKSIASSSSASRKAGQTTHVVAASLGKAKVKTAAMYTGEKGSNQVHVVSPDWLWCCYERWERVDESLFSLANRKAGENIPPRQNPEPRTVNKTGLASLVSNIDNGNKSGLVTSSASHNEGSQFCISGLSQSKTGAGREHKYLRVEDLDEMMKWADEFRAEFPSSSSSDDGENSGLFEDVQQESTSAASALDTEEREMFQKDGEMSEHSGPESKRVKTVCKDDNAHAGKQTYKCDECEKFFASNTSRNAHYARVHLQQKNFKCDMCENEYFSKAQLNYHKQTFHEGIFNFACDQCDARFGKKISLQYHLMSVHSDIRSFKCDGCGAEFKLQENLMKHLQSCLKEFKE